MSDDEIEDEIAELLRFIRETNAIAQALAIQLAPVFRRIDGIKNEIAETHECDKDGHITGFKGQRQTVRSSRIEPGVARVGRFPL